MVSSNIYCTIISNICYIENILFRSVCKRVNIVIPVKDNMKILLEVCKAKQNKQK